MALSPNGQWLVEAGMRLMAPVDLMAWHRWSSKSGWSPADTEAKKLPPHMASLAMKALDAFEASLTTAIAQGAASEDEEVELWNDLEATRVTREALEHDL